MPHSLVHDGIVVNSLYFMYLSGVYPATCNLLASFVRETGRSDFTTNKVVLLADQGDDVIMDITLSVSVKF